ncbi:MAG: hypothetical protein VX063_02640, partial [SAR324 cluster bacterium]|nr:hypothetical protein [SAR324 cluster bacterium]
SQPKSKGPAVFAAGVGNPPAPAGVHGRVQDPGQIWPILGLERPPRIRRGCTACCITHRLFRPKTPQDAYFSRFFRFLFGICFAMPFLIDLLSIFHPNLPPKTHQNRSKIDQKSMPRGTPSWTPFFDRFLIDF